MTYFQADANGIPLRVCLSRFQSVVNNGYTISCQNESLLAALRQDEAERRETPIDWYMFRSGKTVLVDNNGAQFLCIGKTNYWVELAEMVERR